MADEGRLKTLLQAQHGLVSRNQMRVLGFTRHAIAWKLTRGELEPMTLRVFRRSGMSWSWEQWALSRVMSAGQGTGLSHRSAGHLYRLDGIDLRLSESLELSTPRERCFAAEDVVVHRPRDLPLTRVKGIPVTHLPRTLIDLAAVLDSERLELALDSAQRLYPAIASTLPEALAELPTQGHRGISTLRELFGFRVDGPTDSALEVKVWRRLREAGLTPPRRLYKVREGVVVVAEVDFAWPQHKVALHVHGFRWHRQHERFENDASRRSALASRGWLSVMITATRLDEHGWLEDLQRALIFRAPQRLLF